jgi:hypothetical protein
MPWQRMLAVPELCTMFIFSTKEQHCIFLIDIEEFIKKNEKAVGI